MSTRPRHPRLVRLTHWINAGAMLILIGSGWAIYNASPLFAFTFPSVLTLGGWLGGALLWHFAAMWVLVLNGLVYAAYGFGAGRFRREFLPLSAREIAGDMRAAATGRLRHGDSYNGLQKLLYLLVLAAGAVIVVSGLAIWKPVQLGGLARLLGGYEAARVVHFGAMAIIAGFAVVHVAMAVLVPRTLLAMLAGRSRSLPAKT